MRKPKEITPLERYRKLKGYTQADLSQMVGVSRYMISRWESSTESLQSVKGYNLKKIADALGITIEELLGE